MIAVQSQAFVLHALEWLVATFTPLRLELSDASIDIYAGRFTAGELHLVPADTDGPALLSVTGLDLGRESPGPPETAGRVALRADQVLVYTSEQGESRNPEPARWIQYLAWLPDDLQVGQLHVVTSAARTFVLPLKALHGERLADDRYRLGAEIDYPGEPLRATLDLLSQYRQSRLRGVTFDLLMASPQSGSGAVLHGDLVGTADHFHYDATLAANYRDIAEFLQAFEVDTPLAGRLAIRAALSGDAGGLRLTDAHFELDNMPHYGFEVDGELDYRLDGESRLELTGGGELSAVDYLVNWLGIDLGPFGQVQSNVRLGGSLDRPVIEQFRLRTETPAGLTLGLAGSMELVATTGTLAQQEIFVDVSAPTLAALSPWLGPMPYETGPWAASGVIRGDRAALSVDDLVVELGRFDGTRLRGMGRIGRIALAAPAPAAPQPRVEGIDLSVTARVPDSAEPAGMLDIPLPSGFMLDGRARLTGTDLQLALSDGAVTAVAPGIDAELGALALQLHPGSAVPVTALEGSLKVTVADTTALSPYLGAELPSLGALQGSGRLAQERDAFQLQDLQATLDTGGGPIVATGSVGDLLHGRRVSLAAGFERLDTRRLLGLLLDGFDYDKALGVLDGGFRLTRREDAWQLEDLKLRNEGAADRLELEASGSVRDLFGLPAADLQASFSLPDPGLLQALTGMPMKPVAGILRSSAEADTLQGELGLRIGGTAIDAGLQLTQRAREITGLKLRLATPELNLEDLTSGFAAASLQEPGQGESPDRVGQLLLRSPRYPLDITIDIGGISGDNTSIDSLTLHLTGSDNRFILQDFTLVYDQSRAEFRGMIDLSVDPPALSLGGKATALPLDTVVKDLAIDTDLSGLLTLSGGATVTGSSAEQMLNHLNGSLAFALEDARIEGAAYDLLATDVLAWIYSGAMTDESTYLDCAMAKFDIADGVATTDSLYVESPRMVALGKLKLDLVGQRMDLTLLPMSKSRTLQVPSTVRLKGPMSKPKAEISALAAAADATAAAITLIPDLLRRVFGGDAAAQRRRPCEVAPAG